MRIAVIGSGISGLTVADATHAFHDVTLFEAAHYIGGHTNTVDVELAGVRYAIDTGFIVFNQRTYPKFVSMLDRLGVAFQPAPMTFSLRCDRSNLEYRGADLPGLFAQRRNLVRPRFYRLLGDLLRFNRQANQLCASGSDQQTVAEFFAEHSYSSEFYDKYFLPLGSAIWSCPHDRFEQFPIRFIAEFYQQHGMLSVNDRPSWQVISGGSRHYVYALTQPFADRIRLNSPVRSVVRNPHCVYVETAAGWEEFDHVVFACHSDQALSILGGQATAVEREILGAFPYEPNEAVLHTDESLLPRRRRAWASWNYYLPPQPTSKASLTYNMNLLQSIRAPKTFCVTLNNSERIDARQVICRMAYSHPVFDARRLEMQSRHAELIGPNRSSFCGAYWRNGFHEDGVVSGLAVADHLLNRELHEQLSLSGARVASAV